MTVFVINQREKTIEKFDDREAAAQYIGGKWYDPEANIAKDFVVIEGQGLVVEADVKIDLPACLRK